MPICPGILPYYEKEIKLSKVGPRKFRVEKNIEIFGEIIPKGFLTDGASVPRLFWNILSPFTEGFRASLLHDYRYRCARQYCTRKEADQEYYINLKRCGIHCIRRSLVYVFVRLFGWLGWKKHVCGHCIKIG